MSTLTDILLNVGTGLVIGGAAGYGVNHFGNPVNDAFSRFETTGLGQLKVIINSVMPSTLLVAGATTDMIKHYKGIDQDKPNNRIKCTLTSIGFALGYGLGYIL